MPRSKGKRKFPRQFMKMHTKNPGHVCDIEWTIDNVLKFPDETFTSKVKLGRGCKTHLNLLVRIKEYGYYSDFSIGYDRTDESENAIHVVFDFKLVNSEGNVYIQKKVRFRREASHKSIRFLKIKFADPDYFSSATKLTEGEIREPDDDILKNMVSHELVAWDKESVHMLYSLPGGSITIKGCVKVFACCIPLKTTPINQNSPESPSEETKQSELIDHLRCAFTDAIENGQFTDFSFHIQDEVVRAHKFILSARSPKFKTLLQPNSEGFSENEITIRDIEKKVFLHFLHYLYTGIVGVVKWDTVEKLYEVAIKYEVNSLLEHCRRAMMSSLVDRRACRALLFANKHKDVELKKASINFIRDIFKKFKNTDFWISFRKDNPGLALEVVNCVVDNI